MTQQYYVIFLVPIFVLIFYNYDITNVEYSIIWMQIQYNNFNIRIIYAWNWEGYSFNNNVK